MRKQLFVFLTVLLVAFSAVPFAFGEAEPAQESALSAWDSIMKGGWTMVPLALRSVGAVGLAFHIFLLLDPKSITPAGLFTSLNEMIGAGRIEEARSTAERDSSVAGRIYSAGLAVADMGTEKVEQILESAGRRELSAVKRRISMLGYIGQVAPLLGLLGTVLGMIQAFRVVSLANDPRVQSEKAFLLASAIWEAMVTTAAGLLVGIFALVLYYYFSGRLQKMATDLEADAEKISLALRASSSSAGGRP